MDSVALSRDYRNMKGALMIKAYEESGMSLRDWLQQNNVSKDKYYYWRRKPYDYFEHLLTEIPKLVDKPVNEAKPYLDKLLPWSADLPETIRKPKKP